MKHLRASLCLAIAATCSTGVSPATASHPCLTPQPTFSYVDTDNDGCYTDGVDSDSIDADLQASPPMAGMPSYIAPPGTSIVIPRLLVLPKDANPFWDVDNDVWVDGKITGASSLRIEAGGTTHIHGSIRAKAQGFSNGGDLRLGCSTGCGPTDIADGVKLINNGLLIVYDATVGHDVRVKVACAPGGVPSCGGSAYFRRAVQIGDRFRLLSPGGITFEGGAALLEIGNDSDFRTKAVRTDGGTLGFSISFEQPAGLTFGSGARLRAGGSLYVLGRLNADPYGGPVSIGSECSLAASGVFVAGTSTGLGAGCRLKGGPDISIPGELSSVGVASHGGALVVEDGTALSGGWVTLDANAGSLTVGASVRLSTGSANQEIELSGAVIAVGAGTEMTKSTGDFAPILVAGASSVTIDASVLVGAGLDVSLSDAAGLITFTGNQAMGSEGTTATFTAPLGGTCNLTGSTFTKMTLDTSGCGSVVGP